MSSLKQTKPRATGPGVPLLPGGEYDLRGGGACAPSVARFSEIKLVNKSYSVKDGVPAVIMFSQQEYLAATKKLEHCLVAKFQAGRPPLSVIRDSMVKNGKLRGMITISAIWDDRHVVILLDSEGDANAILSSPVRRIGRSWFRLFRWSSSLNSRCEGTRITKWARLPNLPLELFDSAMIKNIVSPFARFIDIDDRTKNLSGLNFARVCIEVDISVPIPDRIWVGLPKGKGFFQAIEFEGNMAYCFGCMKHGHTRAECRRSGRLNNRPIRPSEERSSPPRPRATSQVSAPALVQEPSRVSTQVIEECIASGVTLEKQQIAKNAFVDSAISEGESDCQDLPIAEWSIYKSRRSRKKDKRKKKNWHASADNLPASHKDGKRFAKQAAGRDYSNKIIVESTDSGSPNVSGQKAPLEDGPLLVKSTILDIVNPECQTQPIEEGTIVIDKYNKVKCYQTKAKAPATKVSNPSEKEDESSAKHKTERRAIHKADISCSSKSAVEPLPALTMGKFGQTTLRRLLREARRRKAQRKLSEAV